VCSITQSKELDEYFRSFIAKHLTSSSSVSRLTLLELAQWDEGLRAMAASPHVLELFPVLEMANTKFEDTAIRVIERLFAQRGDGTPDEIRMLNGIKETEARTLPMVRQIVERRRAGDVPGAQAILIRDARPAFVEWLARKFLR
jgi:hypothetical protein